MSKQLSDFDYPLPERLIAQHPAAQRDASKLMRLSGHAGKISHHVFSELPTLLREGDLLVVNDTKVIPAKFYCNRASGGKIEGLYLLNNPSGEWDVLLKNARRCKIGEVLTFFSAGSDNTSAGLTGPGLELLENLSGGRWRVRPTPAGEAEDILQKFGTAPLPPYIKRTATDQPACEDQQRYQTVYATRPGAVAAPTAGLHFTTEILTELAARNIETAHVTLHVGQGTFEPVSCEDLTKHDMHTERFELSEETARTISTAKSQGRRIVAVGTTSVRVLESVAARNGGQVIADSGQTQLFLHPPADFHLVDALITNFHLPKSTLLMLVAAFCDPGGTGGIKTIINAYAEAVRKEYRFFSYGDAMLIE